MILQNILSIFVLSLCLATLFITLVTYFLYRVKQLFKLNQKNNNQILEGVFFKKYAPHIIIKEKQKDNDFDSKLNDRKTLTRFFSIISGIIFISLISGYLFSYFRLGEKTIDAKNYEKLIKNGLLKEYQLNTNLENPEIFEFISDEKKLELSKIFKSFKNKKIGLFKNEKIQDFDKNQNINYENWANYFKRNNIDYKTVHDFSRSKDFNIFIIPQAISLNKKSKDEIEESILSGVGILATGPIASLDGLGAENKDQFSQRIFGVEFKKNTDKKNAFPTCLEGNAIPFLDVTPGLILNTYPTDNSVIAVAQRGVSSVFESNTQAQPKIDMTTKEKIVRSVYLNVLKSRVAWLAFDPPNPSKINVNELYYNDLLMAKSIQWVMKMPLVSISAWKNGAQSVFVPSVEIEDDSDYGYNYIELFKDNKFPLTIFIASDQIPKNQKIIEEETSGSGFFSFLKGADSSYADQGVEFATLGENDSIIQGNNLHYQFQHIQSSRILLEESTQEFVLGYKPPQLKFDNTTLNAVIQNKMSYFVGNQFLFRLGPSFIEDKNLVYFPKSNLKENTMFKTAKFHNTNLLFNSLKDRFSEIEKLKGAAFYNFPTKSITAKNLESAVSNFLKYLKEKDVWKTNYIGLTKWWQEKENIIINLDYDPILTLEVKNLNTYDVNNIYINFDSFSSDFDFLNNEKGVSIKKEKNSNIGHIIIKTIPKNSTLKFEKK